jgi:hypothetical protein
VSRRLFPSWELVDRTQFVVTGVGLTIERKELDRGCEVGIDVLECRLHFLELLRSLGSHPLIVFESVRMPHIAKNAISLPNYVTSRLWWDTESSIVLLAFFTTYGRHFR